MAAVISMAVGAIGTLVGTAIGTSIGGALFGVAATTIGGIIGAGVAGGLLSMARGGDFGKGFLMGAVGGAVGSYFKGAFGGSGEALGGATQFADGTTTAGMLAEQGGAVLDAGGNVIEGLDVASAMGDMAPGGAETFGLGETLPIEGTAISDVAMPGGETGLQEAANASSMGFMGGDFNLGSTPSTAGTSTGLASSAGFNTDPFSMTQTAPSAPSAATDYAMDFGGGSQPSTLEGITAAQEGASTPSWAQGPQQGSYPMSNTGTAPTVPTNNGGGGMFKTTDAWLQNKLGMPQGSTSKLLMGGADSLMKMYEANKLDRQVKGMAPMSFEQFQTQFSDPNAYKVAANRMAKSGRTGTLPVLLARMKNDVRGKYAGYLPGAQQQYLENTAAVGNMRQGALGSLFRPLASLDWGNA